MFQTAYVVVEFEFNLMQSYACVLRKSKKY